jgi:very-short-patch-repair endonuclease
VIVELDSWKHHQTRTSFRNDRRRDGLTLSWGYVTIRITWERLEDEPEREAEQLKAILDQRRRFLRSPGQLLTGL